MRIEVVLIVIVEILSPKRNVAKAVNFFAVGKPSGNLIRFFNEGIPTSGIKPSAE